MVGIFKRWCNFSKERRWSNDLVIKVKLDTSNLLDWLKEPWRNNMQLLAAGWFDSHLPLSFPGPGSFRLLDLQLLEKHQFHMSNQSRPKRSSFCLHLNFDLIYQASCYNTKKQIIVLFNEKPIKFRRRRRRTNNVEHKQKLSSTFNHNQDMNLKKLNSGLQGTHGGRQVITLEVKPRIQEVSLLRFPGISLWGLHATFTYCCCYLSRLGKIGKKIDLQKQKKHVLILDQ